MAVEQSRLVWEIELPPNKLVVMLALADNAHADGSHVFPSLDHTAWKTGYGRRQVRRILGELRADGLIEAVAYGAGGSRPTIYQLHLERGVKKSPPPGDPRSPRSGTGGPTVLPYRSPQATTGDTAMAPEPSVTIIEPSGEPSVSSDGWRGTLRAIEGWDKKGEPHMDALQMWVGEKGWTEEQLEASAIGLAATSEKTLKGYRDMAAAFQRRLNQGYDNPGHGDNGRGARKVSPVPGGKESGSASGWDNRGGADQSST